MEIVSLLKNDKKAGKKLENVLRRWGYDRIKKTESSPSGVNDPLVPPITLQAIDREAFASNPLLTPFVEFVNARLVRNGVAVCSGPQDVKKFSQLKSLVTKYGATVVVEAAKKYIFKNPGKGAEGYAIKNIEREAMIIASKTTY